MRNDSEPSEADRRYEEAHEAHYQRMDLGLALELYRGVMDVFPNTLQAESSRLQLLKIVDAVVPIATIVDTLQTLATAHLESSASEGLAQGPPPQRGLRHEQDREWDRRERARRSAEIHRRVIEHRRGPFV